VVQVPVSDPGSFMCKKLTFGRFIQYFSVMDVSVEKMRAIKADFLKEVRKLRLIVGSRNQFPLLVEDVAR
jgi:hypothetical protein